MQSGHVASGEPPGSVLVEATGDVGAAGGAGEAGEFSGDVGDAGAAGAADGPAGAAGDAGDGSEELAACRPLRADAVRNRARILEAAEEVFASQGVAVPIDAVADRAGLGVGTVYRHFPTKEALVEAIVLNRINALVERAKAYAAADDPAEALFRFLHEFAREAAAKHDLFDALGSDGADFKERCSAQLGEMMGAVGRLLERAAAAGSVRSDLEAEELVSLVVGTCRASSQRATAPDDTRMVRMMSVLCAGLRAERA